MKCESVKELLSPYIDGMTGAKETESIKQHLDGCASCQSDHAALTRLRQALKDMPVPVVPDLFMADFSSRLSQEQNRLVDFQKDRAHMFRRPSWVGWISATAAAVALAIGIYSSSLLPSALRISHEDKPPASSLSVDEIISGLELNPLNPVEPPRAAEEINPFVPYNLGSEYYTSTPYSVADNTEALDSDPAPEEIAPAVDAPVADPSGREEPVMNVASADEYVVQHFYSSNQVASIAESLEQIEKLAREKGLEYNVTSGNDSSLMTVANAGENQSIVLEVPPDQVEQVLQELADQGISQPVMNEVYYGDQYTDIDQELQKVGQSIAALEQNQQLNPEQEQELQRLENNQQILQEQRELIESQAGEVQIEVNFNTTVNP